MDHEPVLISTIAVGLSAAFIGGLLARRLRLPAIVGYIVAGIAVGPFTPGFIADQAIATELAELGVILLMFGVGIHFSIRDLLAVRAIALPGAIGQIAVATVLGVLLGLALGWDIGGGLVLGLAAVGGQHRRAAAGARWTAASWTASRAASPSAGSSSRTCSRSSCWSCCRPSPRCSAGRRGGRRAGGGRPDSGRSATSLLALVKAVVFAVLMIVAGARLVPWLLVVVARDGSRELFTLAVLAIALGIAFAASAVFGVSFALGAFLAGAVVGESDMSHQAAADALPAARRLRGPVLRVGRDAPGPGRAAGRARWPSWRSSSWSWSPSRWRRSPSWPSSATRRGSG